MRRHRTKDPAVRIESIVNRLADEEVWRVYTQTGVFPDWFKIWLDYYPQVLKEYFEGESNDNDESES